jgi:enamine deaminase RidA (YjgF/YER057c/UK114 family)
MDAVGEVAKDVAWRRNVGEYAGVTDLTVLQPPGWPVPRGYSNGIAGTGRVVMIGGQIGWNEQRCFPAGFVAQAAQALRNVLAVLREAGGRPEHLARLTWYVVDVEEYRASLPALGGAYRDTIGRWYPAMTLVQVGALVEREARVEIEATAILPDTDTTG